MRRDQGLRQRSDRINRTQPVAAITAPPVMRRVIDHPRTHRIQLDVALAAQQISLALDTRRFVAAIPQRTSPPISLIDVLNIAPPEHDQQSRNGLQLCLRRQQQMHVIGHQYTGVQLAAGIAQPIGQPRQVGAVVLIAEETGVPVVAALHDVQRYFGEVDAGAAGHVPEHIAAV